MQDYIEIRTPNGSPMKFRGWADKGGDSAWFRTRLTTKLLGRKQKDKLPILGCWNGGSQKLVLVDYDAKTDEQRALAFELCMDACIRHANAISFNSVSGNPRVAFLVDVQPGTPFGTAEATAYLRSKLPEAGHWFDTKGMQRLYVNVQNARFLAAQLPGMQAEAVGAGQAVRGGGRGEEKEGSTITINLTKSATSPALRPLYQAQAADLPPALRLWAKTKDRKALLQILVAAWGLASDKGFNLPINKLSEQLDSTPAQVSRLLKELRNLQVLSCIDPTYIRGEKARTYRAVGVLLGAIQQHKARVQGGTTKPATIKVLQDGKSYGVLLSGIASHSTLQAYLAWVQGLEGCTPKRLADARKYYECDQRKAAAA